MNFDETVHSQEIYDPGAGEILAVQDQCLERLYDYNATRPTEREKRGRMLLEMLAECGENCWIEPPFYSNWGGRFVHFGKNVYANFGLTCVDDTHIYVGDYTMIDPTASWPPPTTPSCLSCGKKPTSTICPSTSGETAGWEPGSS